MVQRVRIHQQAGDVFDPRSGRPIHALRSLGPLCLAPGNCNKRSHHRKPTCLNIWSGLISERNQRKPGHMNQDLVQPEINKRKKPVTKGQIWYDSSYMRYLVKLRGKVEGWLPGIRGERMGSYCLMGESFSFSNERSSVDTMVQMV